MPSTLVRSNPRRGPFTFIGLSSFHLEREDERPEPKPKRKTKAHRCVAHEDDGRPCGLPAQFVDFKRGGHVCEAHKPHRKQEALTLV